MAFLISSYGLYDMHGNKIPPHLVTQVGDAFKTILQEVKKAFCNLLNLISLIEVDTCLLLPLLIFLDGENKG